MDEERLISMAQSIANSLKICKCGGLNDCRGCLVNKQLINGNYDVECADLYDVAAELIYALTNQNKALRRKLASTEKKLTDLDRRFDALCDAFMAKNA